MAGFKVDAFRGIRPRVSARKLAEGEGKTAENTKLGSLDLRPWAGPRTDAALNGTDIETIYRFDNNGSPVWFEWSSPDVRVAPGAILDDALERTYYTGDGFPKMTYDGIAVDTAPYPSDFRRLGIPAPAAAPAITAPVIDDSIVGDTGTVTDNMTSDRFYLTIINNIWPAVTAYTPPYNTRVYVNTANPSPIIGEDIDVGIELGDVYRVTVIDANTFTITNEASEHLSKSPIPTSPRDGSTSDSTLLFSDGGGGFANFAGFLKAPNGLTITKTAHGLTDGAEIVVTSVDVPVRYRWNTPSLDDPPGGDATALPYFTIDYPDTGPYPSAPDGDELTTHECTYDAAGDYFDLFGTWTYEVLAEAESTTVIDTRAYVYTYVSALGEEGPPSPTSAFASVIDGTTVTIDTFTAPPGLGAGYDIANIRIYRTNSTDLDADFQFVAEILDDDTTYDDSIINADLGELLPSADWDPPDPDMQGIISLPNGMMMGFKGRTVYLCEPYFHHAWPAIYDQAVDYDIVGLAAIGNAAVILTDGTPYIASGAQPASMSIRPYKINQACVSSRSILTLGDRAVYASPDGLIELGIDGWRNITEQYFTKKEWATLDPTTIRAAAYDELYIGFYGEVVVLTPQTEDWETFGSQLLTPAGDTIGDLRFVYDGVETDEVRLTLNAELNFTGWPELTNTRLMRIDVSSITAEHAIMMSADNGGQFTLTSFEAVNANRTSVVTVGGFYSPGAQLGDTPDVEVTVDLLTADVATLITVNMVDVYSVQITNTTDPTTQHSFYIDEIIYALGSTGTVGHFVCSPNDSAKGFSLGDTTAEGVYQDIEDDALYYTDGATVFEFDSVDGSPLTWTWRSKEELMKAPVNLGAGMVLAETYPVTLNLYGNGVLRATRTVVNDKPFRLPGGYLASRYEVELSGTARVKEVRLAETIYELSQG